MKRRRTTLLLLGTGLLAGCVKQPSLEEKLAAASSPAEREQIAYYECLHTTHYPLPGRRSKVYFGHEWRQWAICDRMHTLNKTEK